MSRGRPAASGQAAPRSARTAPGEALVTSSPRDLVTYRDLVTHPAAPTLPTTAATRPRSPTLPTTARRTRASTTWTPGSPTSASRASARTESRSALIRAQPQLANCLDPGFKQTLVTESGLKLFKVDVNLLNFSAESSELDISTPDLGRRKKKFTTLKMFSGLWCGEVLLRERDRLLVRP